MPITVRPHLNPSNRLTGAELVSSNSVSRAPASTDIYEPAISSNPFARSNSVLNAVTPTETRTGLQNARNAIIAEFRDNFISSPEFLSTFGSKTWDDVKSDIIRDAQNFGSGPESETFDHANGSQTFSGRIYGLYTEATVGVDGQTQKIYFEID